MIKHTINASDAKDQLSEIINRVTHHKERIIITRRGKEIAAVVPIEDLQKIEELQSKNDLQEAVESLKEARENDTIDLETLKKEIG